MNAAAIAHICLSNDFMCLLSSSIRSVSLLAGLSPEAIKALEESRDTWQNSRTQDFSTLLWMTKLVAAGVILEGPELVHELLNVIKRLMKKPTKDHAPAWITFVSLIGWVCVSIGVAGEFWVDARVNSDDENIQSINIQLLSDASASASAAAKSAKDAQGSADKAVVDAADAQKKADAVGKRANEINRELSRAETLLSGREVIDAPGLVSELARLKGYRLLVKSIVGDSEAYWPCFFIVATAQRAGMDAIDGCGSVPIPMFPEPGITITGPTDDAAQSLWRILAPHLSGGAAWTGGTTGHVPELTVFVGQHQVPSLGIPEAPKAPTRKIPAIPQRTK